jgi:hypothetical protein
LKPAPNMKFAEQRHRRAIGRLIGQDAENTASFMNSLVGSQGSNGRTLRRLISSSGETTYIVS